MSFDPDKWLRESAAAIERATLAAKVAGKTFPNATEWWGAQVDARSAEGLAIGCLVNAHRHLAPSASPASPAPALSDPLDRPIGVELYVPSDRVGGTTFPPSATIRLLQGYVVRLQARLDSMSAACAVADDVLTNVLNHGSYSSADVQRARSAVRNA